MEGYMVAEHTSILLHRAKRGQPERVNQVNHRIHPGKRRSRNPHGWSVVSSARKRRGHSLSNSKCNPSRTAPAAPPPNLPVDSTSSSLSTVGILDTLSQPA